MPKTARKKPLSRSRFKRKRLGGKAYLKGLVVLALLAFLVIIGKFVSFLEYLNSPYSPEITTSKRLRWDGNRRLNLIVEADNLYLLSFDPDKEMVIVKIPENTYLYLPFSFGRWPARSIYSLGQSERPPIGGLLLERTGEYSFGLPIDGVWAINGDKSFNGVVERLRQNPLNVFSVLNESKTGLTSWEFFKFTWAIKGVRTDKVKNLDLGQSNFTSWELLADGSRVLSLNQLALDEWSRNQLSDAQIKDESLTVGIFNATDHPQLAERAARVVTNIGGRVILTTNSGTRLKSSVVTGRKSYTLNRLGEIFASPCLLRTQADSNLLRTATDACFTPHLNVDSSRADVNIFLGEDYFLRYNKE